jgi:hypothetical protein
MAEMTLRAAAGQEVGRGRRTSIVMTQPEELSSGREAKPRWGFRPGAYGGLLALGIIALGLVVIGLGWNGAATYTDFRRQFPYLISGGVLGLGLVIFGASLMIVQAAREDRARLESRLEEIAALLARGAAGGVDAPRDVAGLVVAGASSYHSPSCRLAEGRDDASYLTGAEARGRGLTACRICRPDQEPAAV